MYETILLLFIWASIIFIFIITLILNAKINELEECYNDLYAKIKGKDSEG